MAFSLYSCVLAYISSYYIQSYCLVCLTTYAVNFLLAYFTWLIRKRFDSRPLIAALKGDFQYITQKRRQILVLGGVFFAVSVSLIAFFPDYWNLRLSQQSNQLHTGVTEDGHPYIGADSPKVVVTEYSDYLCFQCKKMNFYLREFIVQHQDKIKLVHRHFPMDSRFNPIVKAPFHEGAGIMSLVAIHAAENGKFWPVNDYFFNIAGHGARIDLKELSAKLGLNAGKIQKALNDPKLRQKLRQDIQQGLKLGLTGTPSYVIDDRVYHGMIPPEVFNTLLN
jgi:protein-disulfide isomerase